MRQLRRMDNSTTTQSFYTPASIAEMLQFKTTRPIYAAIATGELASYEFGRQYRVTSDDLQEYLASKRKRPNLQALGEVVDLPVRSMRDLLDAG